uniref:Flavodoxin-like domain-containing protein n=1 Tax=Alexandrium monilatum TaxID=311494 RepID=A0A7S4S3P1_9DINO
MAQACARGIAAMIAHLLKLLPLFAASARGGKVLVAYYSEGNHTLALARAVAGGASAAGAEVRLLSVSEATFSRDVLWADAVIVGTPVHNANIAAPMKAWLDTWDYQHAHLSTKVGAPFCTGGHLYGGIESTLRSLTAFFQIFAMRVVTAEQDFQPRFPFGVGATTGDPPFDSNAPGHVDSLFLDAGRLLGGRVVREAHAATANAPVQKLLVA